MEKALRFRIGDAVVIAAVLLAAGALALCLLLPRPAETPTVEIYQSGALLYTLPLNADTRLSVGGDYENVVVIEGGRVYVESATCPGGDCVHAGAISRAGQSLVCLPNRLEIRLVGQSDVDMIAR